MAAVEDASPPAIEFFVVSEHAIPGGKFIDTTKLPKVGYISASPSLRVTRLLRISKGSSPSHQVGADGKVVTTTYKPGLILSLTKDDAARLAELTSKHVGKRILIKIAGAPVLAPSVNEPIRDGAMEISFKAEELQAMERSLKALVEGSKEGGR